LEHVREVRADIYQILEHKEVWNGAKIQDKKVRINSINNTKAFMTTYSPSSGPTRHLNSLNNSIAQAYRQPQLLNMNSLIK